ncbi:uncharacterized protein LOC109850103 [Asparagus officinalis]|uniref:uncharacterized protein LOC109850103 n=1 Tax=Asparagus officinalis TaxID=4686 RepID=UPI00098E7AA0|nr:uncharacterized protein LOC109850103 [Asparagus officinalis]
MLTIIRKHLGWEQVAMFKLRFRFHNPRALPRKCYFPINRPILPPPNLIKSQILSQSTWVGSKLLCSSLGFDSTIPKLLPRKCYFLINQRSLPPPEKIFWIKYLEVADSPIYQAICMP